MTNFFIKFDITMSKNIIIILSCILLFIACGKTVNYSGVVFSRHNIPVPNQKISFGLGYGGKDLNDSFVTTTTDANGSFNCQARLKHNGFLNSISAVGDSGSFSSQSSNSGSISNMQIVLK